MIRKSKILILAISGLALGVCLYLLLRKRKKPQVLGDLGIDKNAWWNNDEMFNGRFSEWLCNYGMSPEVLDIVRNKRADATYLQMLNNKGELYFNNSYKYREKPPENTPYEPFYVKRDESIVTMKLLNETDTTNSVPLYSYNGSGKWVLSGIKHGSSNDVGFLPEGIYWRFDRIGNDGNASINNWESGGPLFGQLFLNVEKDACSVCCGNDSSSRASECRSNGYHYEIWTPDRTGTKACSSGATCRNLSGLAETSFNTIAPRVFSAFVRDNQDLAVACCSPVPLVDPITNAWKYGCKQGGYDPNDPSGNKGLCDDIMAKFCDNDQNAKDNSLCGCYPKATHSDVENAIMTKLKGTPLVNSSEKCVYSSCMSDQAYKKSSLKNTECSRICGVISNNIAGDYATIDVNNVTYNIKCGDKDIVIEKAPDNKPIPNNPDNKPIPNNPDNKNDKPRAQNLPLIIGVSVGGFTLIGIILFVIYKIVYKK